MAGQQRHAAQRLRHRSRSGRIGQRQVERWRGCHCALGRLDPVIAPGGMPPDRHRIGQGRLFGKLVAAAHQRAEHAVDELARAAIDQRQHGRDRGVRRRAERQGLDERDAQRKARLGIIGQPRLGRRIDQRVEIGQAAQYFGGDGMGQRPVVGTLDSRRCAPDRRLQRQALA